MRTGLLVFVAAVSLLLLEPVAQACSGDCEPARVVPSHETVMPANAAGVRWYSAGGPVEQVILLDLESNLELPVAWDEDGWIYDLRPAEPLEPDKSYRFELPASDCGDAFAYSFVAAPAVELTTDNLGTLTAEAPQQQLIEVPESVSCWVFVDAVRVRIDLELNPELQPFADVLMYETLVDDEPWVHVPRDFAPLQIGQSWIGRGVDMLFATCPGYGPDGLSQGVHEVRMIARIPGLPGVVLESNPVEIMLECPPEEETGDEDEGGETGSFVPYLPPENDDRRGFGCSSNPTRSGAVVIVPLLLVLACLRRRS